ncbi:putative deacetylase LmbE-like domain-containing protein [Aspergillus avenaceus]|uniref:N-acetylglucosaminylphosphatidylinositol deacetylase n=1 Tax=Aspergillus avenaceus TaxID=36643 RepID=A0A5N6U6W4_ASPAV|nr:putative deacetylase LmbE-like domain-containing protein [Aspergillus avenaceus]
MAFVRLIKRVGRQTRRGDLARIVSLLFLALSLTSVFLYLLLAYYLSDDPRLVPLALRNAKSILFVTAHPDDETLFFGPSIAYRRDDPQVRRSLLAVSSGNYEGIGDLRRVELHKSCAKLSISRAHCAVLDRADLQDNPRQWWNEDKVADLVTAYVRKWKVDLIITFDHGGVSGHINHRAISAGVRADRLCPSKRPSAPQVYIAIRPYTYLPPIYWRILKAIFTTPLDDQVQRTSVHDTIPLEAYNSRALIVSPLSTYFASRRAFQQHASQYSWDRMLYLIMSRYMWLNNLERVE